MHESIIMKSLLVAVFVALLAPIASADSKQTIVMSFAEEEMDPETWTVP